MLRRNGCWRAEAEVRLRLRQVWGEDETPNAPDGTGRGCKSVWPRAEGNRGGFIWSWLDRCGDLGGSLARSDTSGAVLAHWELWEVLNGGMRAGVFFCGGLGVG